MPIYQIKFVREKLSDHPAPKIINSKIAVDYLISKCFTADELWREKCFALYVDRQRNIVGHLLIGVGGADNVTFDKKLILKGAFESLAYGIIVAHNHPSGIPLPGQTDIKQTKDIKKACNVLEIQFLDHIILGQKEYFSFTDEVKKPYSITQKKFFV